jgi:MerR family transcriptional regulator/heat shock protein HspR
VATATTRSTRRHASAPRIGDVARAFGIHPQTLRLYERAGLLEPGRSSGNVRRYADDDLERLETILGLTRERGVNLAGVAMILRLLDRIDELERNLEPGPAGVLAYAD